MWISGIAMREPSDTTRWLAPRSVPRRRHADAVRVRDDGLAELVDQPVELVLDLEERVAVDQALRPPSRTCRTASATSPPAQKPLSPAPSISTATMPSSDCHRLNRCSIRSHISRFSALSWRCRCSVTWPMRWPLAVSRSSKKTGEGSSGPSPVRCRAGTRGFAVAEQHEVLVGTPSLRRASGSSPIGSSSDSSVSSKVPQWMPIERAT